MATTRLQASNALQARLTGAYAFGNVTRRLQSPETMATPNSPGLAILPHEDEYEQKSPMHPPRRTLKYAVIIYVDVGSDPNAIPADILGEIRDAFDQALRPNPAIADEATKGRCTLGGLVEWAIITGTVTNAAGDKSGKGLSLIPIEICLP